MIRKTLHFQMSRRLVFGAGAVEELPEAVAQRGANKVLVVTDEGVVGAGIAGRIGALLRDAGIDYGMYDRVEPDPRVEIARECRRAAAEAGCDLLIGVGGGSSMDIAKVAAVMLANEGDILDYVGIGRIPRPGIATILIPTTAGTGSEVTPIAVLSHKQERLKKGVVSDHLYADLALVDPDLTASLPPLPTAYTGMDALTHAIEAYTNRFAHPFVDPLALEAIRLIGLHLRRAVCRGDDPTARYHMCLGSVYGGLCLGPVNTAAVHALAYPLGGTFDVPHGLANSLLLPYVMEYNLVSDLQKYADIAAALGENMAGLSLRDAADLAVGAVRRLSLDVDMVQRMRDLDVPEQAIDGMAEAAMKVTRLLNNNSRTMTKEAAAQIYRNAY